MWLYLAGRGAGKTRTAAEWLAYQAVTRPKTRWAIVAATFTDGRDTCVEGESGILDILNRYGAVQSWNRSQGRIRLRNGSTIQIFSAEKPDRLRGPQHHGAWCDELAAWTYMRETWDQLQFGLRLGDHPKVVVTTTPKPTALVREFVKDPTVAVTRGSTFDNAKNLAAAALRKLLAKYGGTRLGRQELYGEVMEDVEGALWTLTAIETDRVGTVTDPDVARYPTFPADRIVRRLVSVDPAITNTVDSDETGIIVVSRDRDGDGFVEADLSLRGSPTDWATRAVWAFDHYEADAVIVEDNQGGDMTENTLRVIRPNLPIIRVHASQSKRLRAEPVSAMYDQHRIHHVGVLADLEGQMCSWVPGEDSPDRLDALVHGLTELMDTGGAEAYLRSLAIVCTCGIPNPKTAKVCLSCGTPLETSE